MTTATKERRAKAGGITLSAATLKVALKSLKKVFQKPPARLVLQNVLLSNGVLSGSDGEVRIDVTLEDAPPGCDFLLPEDRFSAIVNTCTADEITLTPADNCVVITAGRGKWTLPTESTAEYPAWEPAGVKEVVRLPADQFVRAVLGSVFATDNESSRYALGAVLVEVRGENVHLVGTDGRRLASVQCEHDQAVDDRREPDHKGEKVEPPLLVPARVMSIISGLAAHAGDDAVQLEATGKELIATVGSARVTALLLDGRYPRWRDTVPERDAKPTTVDRAALHAATRAAAICASEESKGVTFTFSPEGILLQGKSSEKGESVVTCDIVDAGDKASVKLDPAFVVEWLNGIASDADPNVEVEVVDAQSAVILRCGDNTGVIMPMAVD
jgi:DNA polymerase-3 subunit beta